MAVFYSSALVLDFCVLVTVCLISASASSDPFASEIKRVSLFVGVVSSFKNIERRRAIRETWGKRHVHCTVRFVIGRPHNESMYSSIALEASTWHDVILAADGREGYYNIAYQTYEVFRAVVMGRFSHLMKVDDDSYVRIDPLLGVLQQWPRSGLYMGNIESPGGGPDRNPNSRWYISPAEWPEGKPYPQWAHGCGYLVSADLAWLIASGGAVQSMPNGFFKLEDIASASWIEFIRIGYGVNVTYAALRSFNYLDCKDADIVSHYVTPAMQYCIYRTGKCCT